MREIEQQAGAHGGGKEDQQPGTDDTPTRELENGADDEKDDRGPAKESCQKTTSFDRCCVHGK
jgi:hypothetical protein